MPVILRNNDNSIEVDINFNLKYTVSKGGFDVIYHDKGDGVPYVYVIIRSNSFIDNTLKLDWRDTTSPDAEFTSAEDLRDLLLSWNMQSVIIATSALPEGAATAAKQLPDGHNVAVSNMIPAVETGLATSAKQNDVIDEISNKDIMVALKALILAIANPSYVDKSVNQIRAVVTGTVTSSTTVAISDITLKGTYQPRVEILSNNLSAWANVVRNKIT